MNYAEFTAYEPVELGTKESSIFDEWQAIWTLRVILFEFPLQRVILVGGQRQ